MKRLLLAVLAFSLVPAAVAAQDAPPPGPPAGPPDGPPGVASPNPQRMATMRLARRQLEQLHEQTRSQIIAALTLQHRAQLANLIGQFAVTPNADPAALVRSVDAVLSRNEAQSVMSLVSTERANARTMMQAARAQYESSLPADQRAAMDAREAQRTAMQDRRPAPLAGADPGRELLRALVGGQEARMHPAGAYGRGGPPGYQ